MKARVLMTGEIELTPENEAEHYILHHTEFETIEKDFVEKIDLSDASILIRKDSGQPNIAYYDSKDAQ